MRLPAATLRLFPHTEGADREPAEHPDFVIGRLLEEGDGDDLRWLTATFGEDELVSWLGQRGQRQLSIRSFAFWTTLLGGATRSRHEDSLWTL